ncbi:hypothetical protein BST96_04970 [Oceanicoccus sagamiensis]|uniref:Uncharacterized protein n=1 Tax=Oceanicoccus sagamiensis TaxID=716816 RepID=A0A1X9NF07_9GAMM|nr:hypothetical protein BST96_04970 [Oceanicoccus sagamiensis]
MLLRLDLNKVPFLVWTLFFVIPLIVISEGFISGEIAMFGRYLSGDVVNKEQSPIWFYVNVLVYVFCDILIIYAYKNKSKMSWK